MQDVNLKVFLERESLTISGDFDSTYILLCVISSRKKNVFGKNFD